MYVHTSLQIFFEQKKKETLAEQGRRIVNDVNVYKNSRILFMMVVVLFPCYSAIPMLTSGLLQIRSSSHTTERNIMAHN